MASSRDITALLGDWALGDPSALNQLLPLVYAELRRIAARQLRGERTGHTLQPTALVHEAYLRLVDQRHLDWRNRAHFFGAAAHVMRRILVDHARRHKAGKRGDGVPCVSIDEAIDVAASREIPVLALTIEESAEVLKVSASTAKREWRTAKAWLKRELGVTAQS